MRASRARATVRVHGPYGGRGPTLPNGLARPGRPRAPAHHPIPVHLIDGSGLRDTRRSPIISIGLVLANRGVILGIVAARDLLDLAAEAEASGAFDALWVGDSLLAKPRLEAVTLLSTLAGITRRMRLGVGCMATFVHRHPVMLAHPSASLDLLSGRPSVHRG